MISALGTSIVASLTGCLGQVNPSSDSTATDTPTPRDGSRQVRITSIGTSPDATPLSHSVKVLRSRVNADQTARITVEVTNTADQPVWNTASRITAFSDFVTQEGPDGQRLLLLQPEEQYPTVRSGCWRADLSESQINHAYTNVVGERRYEPGETKATQFDVYGYPENTGPCLTPGEYPVDSLYVVGDDSNADTAEWEYRWGFSLTVEKS